MADYKSCVQCGHSYELIPTHWHKSKDGFHARCRTCRNKQEKTSRKKKRNKKLEEIERGAVDLFVASARIGGANIPHSSELLEVLMSYFGGAAGFGSVWMKQYYDSPAGGAFRTKMLETMVRLTSTNTAMGGAKKPLDLMDEKELEGELRRQLLEAAMSMSAKRTIEHEEPRGIADVGGSGADAPQTPAVLPPVLNGDQTG